MNGSKETSELNYNKGKQKEEIPVVDQNKESGQFMANIVHILICAYHAFHKYTY